MSTEMPDDNEKEILGETLRSLEAHEEQLKNFVRWVRAAYGEILSNAVEAVAKIMPKNKGGYDEDGILTRAMYAVNHIRYGHVNIAASPMESSDHEPLAWNA